MAKEKATHDGFCQICGSRQKLPSGKMAKHGYTVDWGFFAGVCPGSDHLPFQQEKVLAEKQVAHVDEMIDGIRKHIKSLQTKALKDNLVWKNVYAKDVRGKGSYQWEQVELRLTFKTYDAGTFGVGGYWTGEYRRVGQKEEQKWQRYEMYGVSDNKTEAQLRIELNEGFIEHLELQITRYLNYIEWQRKRCAEWKIEPLLQTAEEEAAATKNFILVDVAGGGFVVDAYSMGFRGRKHVLGADKAKAIRYTERGAKTAIGRFRAYKTLKIEEY